METAGHNLGLFYLQQDFRLNLFYNPTECCHPPLFQAEYRLAIDEAIIQSNSWSCGMEQREGVKSLLPYQFDRKSAAVIQRCQPQELLRAEQGTVRLPVLLWHWVTV